MDDNTDLLFDLPSVARKKVSAAFDGGRITSDGGVALLALADRRIGIVDRFAGLIADPRDPALVTHSLASILRARVLAIACGYEDANDLDRLRGDPAFKKLVDDAVIGLFKSGEIDKIYAKWFTSAVPPKSINMNMPMSAALKRAIAKPTDSPEPKDYE